MQVISSNAMSDDYAVGFPALLVYIFGASSNAGEEMSLTFCWTHHSTLNALD